MRLRSVHCPELGLFCRITSDILNPSCETFSQWIPESDEMADPIFIIGLLGTAGTITKTILRHNSSVEDASKEL